MFQYIPYSHASSTGLKLMTMFLLKIFWSNTRQENAFFKLLYSSICAKPKLSHRRYRKKLTNFSWFSVQVAQRQEWMLTSYLSIFYGNWKCSRYCVTQLFPSKLFANSSAYSSIKNFWNSSISCNNSAASSTREYSSRVSGLNASAVQEKLQVSEAWNVDVTE